MSANKFIISLWVFLASWCGASFVEHQPSAEGDPYFSVTGPCGLVFPKDHGAHPGYRTEWWYYTGNVSAESGRRYGFQLTFFRSQMSPPGSDKAWPSPSSAWRTQEVFLAHTALSDIDGKRFHSAERTARGALGLAGRQQTSEGFTVFVRDWSAEVSGKRHRLKARASDFALELNLEALKDAVPHGESGYSLKGKSPERASCYYSLTRLRAEGTVIAEGKSVAVSGTAWMDHEFSSAPLESDLEGWDWMSLQLSDQTELMVYFMRQKGGTISPVSSGTYVDVSGSSTPLTRDSLQLEVTAHWESPHSGAVYPSQWRLQVVPLALDLTISANLADQEMLTPESTGVTYWEGSVKATGTVLGTPVSAEGYVELTGYARPFDAPL